MEEEEEPLLMMGATIWPLKMGLFNPMICPPTIASVVLRLSQQVRLHHHHQPRLPTAALAAVDLILSLKVSDG